MTQTLQSLALYLDLRSLGDSRLPIENVASLPSAGPRDLCFIQHRKYLKNLVDSQCACVIVPEDFDNQASDKALLYSKNPHLSFIRAIDLLRPQPMITSQLIHPSAQIGSSVKIADSVRIGAFCSISDGVTIDAGTRVSDGCIIGANTTIGRDCILHSRVTIEHQVSLGSGCIIHPGAVIGSDGFGLVATEKSWVKIPQIGRVIIGDNVEIGANTTIDRGALDDTIIEDGCKLDNQIQVAHNVRIGANTAIAACVGIAGSATIGKFCKISGAAVVLGHLTICDNVTITAMSLVTKDVKKPGTYSSGTPLLENSDWHRSNVRYKSLDELAKRVKALEKFDKN
ncbi:MAG: UDP-3-O-[3-hydroxymyristoyl] glucosamine N-acyltransferase [Gammaproteobacteria bacterium]|jgi:UDP-3-O-[3-hydroxymyristoyl] glucosamine N-acyltransferase